MSWISEHLKGMGALKETVMRSNGVIRAGGDGEELPRVKETALMVVAPGDHGQDAYKNTDSGHRPEGMITIYSDFRLIAADEVDRDVRADHVLWRDKTWEVVSVSDYMDPDSPSDEDSRCFEARAVRVKAA